VNLDSPLQLQRQPTGRDRADAILTADSWLIAPALRPSVHAFWRFVRAAHEIADAPDADPHRKLVRLAAMEAALIGGTSRDDPAVADACRLREVMAARDLSADNPRRIIEACRADAMNRACRSWSDLLAYCRYSAAPIGRFLLELHDEPGPVIVASDALCSALLILRLIQDCQADYRDRHRIYIPSEWLDEAGLTPRALLGPRSSPALRRVFDRLLDGVDRLNRTARPLPRLIMDRGLRMEAAAMTAGSRRLAAKLRRRDPLSDRIGLSQFERMSVMAAGVVRGWRGR
jgi:farnesyl-diphosphate farnesyltransferase